MCHRLRIFSRAAFAPLHLRRQCIITTTAPSSECYLYAFFCCAVLIFRSSFFLCLCSCILSQSMGKTIFLVLIALPLTCMFFNTKRILAVRYLNVANGVGILWPPLAWSSSRRWSNTTNGCVRMQPAIAWLTRLIFSASCDRQRRPPGSISYWCWTNWIYFRPRSRKNLSVLSSLRTRASFYSLFSSSPLSALLLIFPWPFDFKVIIGSKRRILSSNNTSLEMLAKTRFIHTCWVLSTQTVLKLYGSLHVKCFWRTRFHHLCQRWCDLAKCNIDTLYAILGFWGGFAVWIDLHKLKKQPCHLHFNISTI